MIVTMAVVKMKYGIIRIEKFKQADIRGIEIHDERLSEESKTNPDINFEKSNQNYSLHKRKNETYAKTVQDKINALGLKKGLRKNINTMLQAMVTASKEFFENATEKEQEEFFQKAYDFIAEKYGKENIVSATVHLDEETPHMHINFVPVTVDGRLSAKEVYSPTECRKLQDEAFTSLFEPYSLERGEVGEVNEKGYSIKKHKSTQAAKRKEIEDARKALESEKMEFEKYKKESFDEISKAKILVSEIPVLEQKKSALQVEISGLNDTLVGHKLGREEIENIKPEKGLLGAVKGVTVAEIENLKRTALDVVERDEDYEQDKITFGRNKKTFASEKRMFENEKKIYKTQLEKTVSNELQQTKDVFVKRAQVVAGTFGTTENKLKLIKTFINDGKVELFKKGLAQEVSIQKAMRLNYTNDVPVAKNNDMEYGD
jgi:hypothetical protein